MVNNKSFSSKMSDFRMRGMPTYGVLIGFKSFFFFLICSGFFGGSAPEYAEEGIYYLREHSELTQVSEQVWKCMSVIRIVGLVGIAFAALSMLVAFYYYYKKAAWYLKSKDYTNIIPIIFLLDMAFAVICMILCKLK